MAGRARLECAAAILLLVGSTHAAAEVPAVEANAAALPGKKPQAPVPPPPLTANITPEDCADQQKRAAVVAQLKGENPSFLDYPTSLAAHSERLMEWKSERLRRAGWSKEQQKKFGHAVLSDPQFKDEMQKGFAEFGSLTKVFLALDEKDEQAMCQAAFPIQAHFDVIIRHTMAQWKIMGDALDAEARRLGVSLDD